jgi:hypothetical protein
VTLGVILVTGGSEAELEELRQVAKADAILSKAKLDRLVDVVKDTYRRHHPNKTIPPHARS